MTDATTYNVMITGELLNEKTDVITALASLFKKSEQQIEALLNSAPVAVKKKVEPTVAEKYKKAIESKGARVTLEAVKAPLHASWSLEPTEEELSQKASVSVTSESSGRASFEAKEISTEEAPIQNKIVEASVESNVYATPQSDLIDDDDVEEYANLSLSQIYFSFEGRINRSTYWLKYILPIIGITFLIVFLAMLLPSLGLVLIVIGVIPLIWSSIAVAVKRLHDINLSGWWYLYLAIIPSAFEGAMSQFDDGPLYLAIASASVVCNLTLFIMNGFIPGKKGRNQYGVPQA